MSRILKTLLVILTLALYTVAAEDNVPQLCHIRITTQPEGAKVSLDNTAATASPALFSDVQPGLHLITIGMKGFKTHRENIILSTGQKATRSITLDPVTGLVLIHTTPREVEVKLDGVNQGRTPLLLTDIALGQYRLELIKPGYIPKTINLKLESRAPQLIEETLLSDAANLRIESVPSDADIIYNGMNMGKTPASLERIPAGSGTLELKKKGYQDYKKTIKLSAGQDSTLKAMMEAIPAGLTIVSLPGNARIYINNEFRGNAPVTLKDLEPGTYRLRADLTGYESTARTVELKHAESRIEELRLDGNCGQIEITTEPAGIKVFIDGRQRGITSSGTDQTDRVSNPLTIDLVPEGKHTVKLTDEKFFPQTLEVTVERGKTQIIHASKMKRRFIPNYEVRTSSNVYKGVLIELGADGSVKLEVMPGIFKTIPRDEIRSRKPIRAPVLAN